MAEDPGPGHLRPPRPQACDTVLAAMTATLASAQALAYLDRPGTVPVTADGTLELVLPDWQWRRRTSPAHPACGCGASARRAAARAPLGTGRAEPARPLPVPIRTRACGTMPE